MRAPLLLFLLACPSSPADTDSDSGDSGGTPVVGDPATVPLNGVCSLDTRWGGFRVEANSEYSAIDGYVSNGVVPDAVLEEVGAESGCVLLKRNNPYCNPICGAGETCDFDGSCLPYPENQDLGTVTIEGLRSAVVMEASESGKKYFYTDLDPLAFDAGVLVRLTTEGVAYTPQTMHAVGVGPLTPSTVAWVVTEGEDLTLAWDIPTGVVRSEVFLSLNVDQHGLTPLKMECSFDDDGSASAPASLIDALLNAGVTGFPTGKIQRRTADKVQLGAGCADFILDYTQATTITVTGHTPCDSNEDCPDDETCDLPTQTCR